MLCGWLQREQQDVIAFLREENRVLKARLEGRRLHLDDHERRRLAELGYLWLPKTRFGRVDDEGRVKSVCDHARRRARPTTCQTRAPPTAGGARRVDT